MRTTNASMVRYAREAVPKNPADLPAFLQRELDKLGAAIAALALGHLDSTTVAPSKPRDGDIRLADGATWNPGSGPGVYCYYGGGWHFLG